MENDKKKDFTWSIKESIGVGAVNLRGIKNIKFSFNKICKHGLPYDECKEKECLVEDVMES